LKPQAKITPQPLTITPITPTTVLVDDPVALVDDPNTLVGSKVTPIRDIKTSISSNTPQGKIQPRR
jgi:hypothetical protein